ncbi:MAG: hypothetical protein WAS21_07145 [Geminicoccaceae bacterium]
MNLSRWAAAAALLVLPFVPTAGMASTYHVDQAGKDSASGLSDATPWRTLARVNVTPLRAGDSVLLKRGGIWRESLAVPGHEITYGAYGTGADPVISGSNAVSGWTAQGSSWCSSLTNSPHDVWFGEVRGRYRIALAHLARSWDWWWDAEAKRLCVRTSGQPVGVTAAVRRKPIETNGFNTGLRFAGIVVQGFDMSSPFGSGSVWNRPPGSQRSSIGPVAGFRVGLTSWEGGAWSSPIWYAKSSDPLVDVLYLDNWWQVATGQWRRSGNSADVERAIRAKASVTFPFPSNVYSSQSTRAWVLPADYDRMIPSSTVVRFRAPPNAVPASAADGHMDIIQPDGRMLECYGAIRLSSGSFVCGRYQLMEPWRQGDAWMNGLTASMIPMFAGMIRDEEAYRGKILHALQVRIGPQALTTAWTAPAAAFDRDAMSNGTPYSGSLPLGSRLALPVSVDPDHISGVRSTFGRMIARSMKNYGAIIIDRGGSNGITIGVETGATHPDLVNYTYGHQAEIEAIFRLVERAQ